MNNANTDADRDITEAAPEIHPAVITWALVIGLIVAFVVTASSFKLSFTTLLDLGTMAGMRDSAWVIPVVLDGPILAASILRIALSQHTDRRTVLGRRFIIAVFTVTGALSMAGNAYHAVLTVSDLNAAVAAAIGALAPLMVMTMAEMMSVAISAPRRRPVTTTGPVADDAAATTAPSSIAATQDSAADEAASKPVETVIVEEDLDNGLLKPAVWKSVNLYLAHPDWSLTDIARHLQKAQGGTTHTSTVSRHIKAWTEVQQKIASQRSLDPHDDHPPALAHADHADDDVEGNTDYGTDDQYAPAEGGRDYAEAAR
ncbi:DUF2637 domain-containing protein [Rhodococcus fascians]|uniref:DUF2637 domain-containing protein n=1 Tax=Rhodococcoides fascians TaxID=1828 RepID=UPI001C605051|nr:DUF2637 domain-containing protein [Rhodococcus fascians]MBW4781921.1 DUF2637 domain-containing protein [Rhodococcus fascians]